ncbi:MAG: hypothetical protein Q9M37_04440 [Desulfonauticus sp.]|nr:hypothetical protein [Desulfonauticus sp.]
MLADEKVVKEWSIALNLEFFVVNYKRVQQAKENRGDLFKILEDEFKKSNKINVFIIDEIQILGDLYINGQKELLKEFLNFCVSLTPKELHLVMDL